MLAALLRGEWRRVLGAALLGALTVLSGVGLLSASGALISRSAQQPETLLLLLPLITSVRMFGISRAALRYAERLVSHDLTLRLIARVREQLLARLIPLAPAALQGSRGGELLSRVRADVDDLQGTYLKLLAPVLVAVLACAVTLALLWRVSPVLTGVVFGLYLLLGVAVPCWARRAAAVLGAGLPSTRSELSAHVLSSVHGLADLVTSGAQPQATARTREVLTRMERAEGRRVSVTAVTSALRDAVGGFGLMAALFIVAVQVSAGGTPGFLLAAVALGVLASFEAVGNVGGAWAVHGEIRAAAERVGALHALSPAVTEPARSAPLPRDVTLRWEGVSFRYPDREDFTLEAFSLELPARARVALVGPSGIGKSTVLRLALRFWDPQEGRVTLGGLDVRELSLPELRSCFAWAPQQAEVFDGTLRENLLTDAPDDRAVEVLRDLGLSSLLDHLPGGLSGWVGEYGARLSAGERARLSVARALLRNAPILLLDEPTAHLDVENARRLLDATLRHAAAAGSSVLLVTHQRELLSAEWQVRSVEGAGVTAGA